jgi:hypothetical protein
MLRVLMTPARRTARLGLAGLAVSLLAVSLAACGTKTPDAGPSVPSASPSSTLTPEQSEAVSKAMAAYSGYVTAYNQQAKTADYQETELRKYIADPLASKTIFFLHQIHDAGIVQTGDQVRDPKIIKVNVDGAFKSVTIGDCIDSSNVALVYKASGSPAAQASASASKRTKVELEAVRYDDGRWLVRNSNVIEGATC